MPNAQAVAVAVVLAIAAVVQQILNNMFSHNLCAFKQHLHCLFNTSAVNRLADLSSSKWITLAHAPPVHVVKAHADARITNDNCAESVRAASS